MTPVAFVDGIAGVGLVGDCHANPASPRHVLLFTRRELDSAGVSPEVARANVIVDGDVDELPSGTMLRVGGSLVLRLTLPCESCQKLEQQRRGLARELQGRRGVLARVVGTGRADVGDAVAALYRTYEPLAHSWVERVEDVVRNLPDGMSLRYTQLATMAGLQPTYCRAFSGVLKRMTGPSVAARAKRVLPAKAVNGNGPHAMFWEGESYYRDQEEPPRTSLLPTHPTND